MGNAPWLLFINADMLLSDNFTKQIFGYFKNGYSFHPKPFESGNMGVFICQRQYFQDIFGYDEVIHGWNDGDNDIYERLAIAYIKKAYFLSLIILTCYQQKIMLKKH